MISLVLYLPRINGFRYAFKFFPHNESCVKHRIAVLVPARNESSVIGDLFSSISVQDYDKDFYDVFVIVQDENDPTIKMSEKYGAKVTVISDQHCKGDALNGFFEKLGDGIKKYDAFVIVDADGVLSPTYLSELNLALENDAEIFVTKKLAKNFLGDKNDRSVFSNCSALTYPMVDDCGNAYRTKKKMPLNICGQGLMIRREVIEEIGGWPYRTMTEDYELKLDSLLRGYRSLYYPYAVLYTEEAISHKENFSRRVRWLTGYKQCDKKYKESIREQVREKKRINKGEAEYFFGLLPYFLFLVDTIVTVAFGLGLAIFYYVKGIPYFITALMLLVALPTIILYGILNLFSLFAMIIAHDAFGMITQRECLAVLLYNPIYLLEYVCVYLVSLKRLHSNNAIVWQQTERVTDTLKKKKRSKKEIIDGVQNTLEGYRRFSMETIAYGDKWVMPNGDFKYRQNSVNRIETGFWRSIMAMFGPILIKVKYGAKVVGKKNLKLVKKSGAITICNHIHYLDTLFVRQGIGHINSFHTMAPWNNKKGAGGHIIRHGGMLPLSSDYTAMKNLAAEMERLLKKGKRINFYPEHSMWWNYQKPRPMKSGAFHYAVKFDVPVLPLFCTFKKSKRGGLKKLRIHILPAIYPNKSLPPKERESQMKATAEQMWKDTYESVYDRKLEYLSL